MACFYWRARKTENTNRPTNNMFDFQELSSLFWYVCIINFYHGFQVRYSYFFDDVD